MELKRMSRKGGAGQGTVVHEDDGSCCRREVWELTARKIVGALALDGEAVGWLLPEGFVTGEPTGRAQRLRENVLKAAGGELVRPGPKAQQLLDEALAAWEAAGAKRCAHIEREPRILMAHAPEEIRCAMCVAAYAQAHEESESEFTCDLCHRKVDEFFHFTGPLVGILFAATVCHECFDLLEEEAQRG